VIALTVNCRPFGKLNEPAHSLYNQYCKANVFVFLWPT
jgi:hypothetical protein